MIHSFQFFVVDSFFFFLVPCGCCGGPEGEGCPAGGNKFFPLDTLWLRSGEAPSLSLPPPSFSNSRTIRMEQEKKNEKMKKKMKK